MKGGRQSIKAVLDTNVFISAIFWTGNPHKIVALAIDKKIEVYVSPEILEELERVLHRAFRSSSYSLFNSLSALQPKGLYTLSV